MTRAKNMHGETGLVQRAGGMYYLRVKVPSDLLQHFMPKHELWKTLGTKSKPEAKRRAAQQRATLLSEFERLRNPLASPPHGPASKGRAPDEEELKTLAARVIASILGADEELRIDGVEPWLKERFDEQQEQDAQAIKRAIAV